MGFGEFGVPELNRIRGGRTQETINNLAANKKHPIFAVTLEGFLMTFGVYDCSFRHPSGKLIEPSLQYSPFAMGKAVSPNQAILS
jgi:hypothetical protein